MISLGKQIQTSLRLISVSLSNVLYCIYDVSVVSRCTLYLNKILFTLNPSSHKLSQGAYRTVEMHGLIVGCMHVFFACGINPVHTCMVLYKDEMPQYKTFHHGLHWLLR